MSALRRANQFWPTPDKCSPPGGGCLRQELDHGFLRLYDLDFSGGQEKIESWEKLNPDDPMGPASEATGVSFAEFNRWGCWRRSSTKTTRFSQRGKLCGRPTAPTHAFEQRGSLR